MKSTLLNMSKSAYKYSVPSKSIFSRINNKYFYSIRDSIYSISFNSFHSKMVEKNTDSKKGKSGPDWEKLEGAEIGKVVTRFPPEPSGYLHIGHMKACILNRHLADLYQGKMVIRFDDTNPDKESSEFVENIINDLKYAKIEWQGEIQYVTDSFAALEEEMTKLISKGQAYCDNTPTEEMRDKRDKGIPTQCRDQSIEENLAIWEKMKDKSISKDSEYRKYCVRGKFPNIKDKNKCMRDPVFYRFCDAEHYRLGTTYKIYPTYDFACPYVDHKGGVTHMMRTNEYADRIPMYRWVEEALGLPRMHIYEYSRLCLVHTVLSKRKLKWFVETGRVDGWDDPRFPTLRGILRRGVKMEALKEFILSLGPSKNTNLMHWDSLYSINKSVIDPTAKRVFAVSAENPIPVEILNFDEPEESTVDWHPKNKEVGQRTQFKSAHLYIEKEDAQGLTEDLKLTLYKWGNSRVAKLDKDENGEITKVYLNLTPEDKDFKKTKIAHWISSKEGHVSIFLTIQSIKVTLVEFDHLITKEKIEENDNIEDLVNPNSKIETTLLVEPAFALLQATECGQFERRGYFYVDKVAAEGKPAVVHYIPDGSTKTMSVVKTKVDPKSLAQGKETKLSKKQEEREKKKEREKEKDKKEKVVSEEDKKKAEEAIAKKKQLAEEKKKEKENKADK